MGKFLSEKIQEGIEPTSDEIRRSRREKSIQRLIDAGWSLETARHHHPGDVVDAYEETQDPNTLGVTKRGDRKAGRKRRQPKKFTGMDYIARA